MKLCISSSYTTNGTSEIEIPNIENFTQIESYYIKWDTFFYRLKGSEDYHEIELNTDISEGTDWKRPIQTEIFPHNIEDDTVNYSSSLSRRE